MKHLKYNLKVIYKQKWKIIMIFIIMIPKCLIVHTQYLDKNHNINLIKLNY